MAILFMSPASLKQASCANSSHVLVRIYADFLETG
jgi:hypothetical protein